jgi:hypothetical protein
MNESDFGKRMKPWLDRSAAGVGEMQATRLKSARLRAMERFREPVRLLGLVTVGAGTADTLRYAILPRALMWLPLLILLTALALKSVQETDLGELDAQLLTQELPPQAFIDQDLRSWLGKARD